MAIYTNLKAREMSKHGIFESSRIKETNHLYDCLVRDAGNEVIPVDNSVALKIGEFTGNGLQEVYATVAATTDKIAVTGAVAIIKDAFTKAQNQIYNFYTPAGTLVKTYEILPEDIFAVADYQFTEASATNVKKDAYVVVDGNGQWVAQTGAPSEATYGFIGKIHSLSYDNLGAVTMVRIQCVQNVQL